MACTGPSPQTPPSSKRTSRNHHIERIWIRRHNSPTQLEGQDDRVIHTSSMLTENRSSFSIGITCLAAWICLSIRRGMNFPKAASMISCQHLIVSSTGMRQRGDSTSTSRVHTHIQQRSSTLSPTYCQNHPSAPNDTQTIPHIPNQNLHVKTNHHVHRIRQERRAPIHGRRSSQGIYPPTYPNLASI